MNGFVLLEIPFNRLSVYRSCGPHCVLTLQKALDFNSVVEVCLQAVLQSDGALALLLRDSHL